MADASFNGDTLTITLPTGVTEVDVQRDIYSAWKRWVKVGDNSKYEPAFDTTGGDPISGTLTLAPAFFIRNDLGWRLKTDEEDITVSLVGNLYPRTTDNDYVIPTVGAFTAFITNDRSANALLINDLSAGDVFAQVVAAITTNTEVELVSVPGASPDLHSMIQFLYMWIRNEVTQTGALTTLKKDDGTTLGTGATSEAGGTVTKGKIS